MADHMSKKSVGSLRPAAKNKPQSPDLMGYIHFRADLLEAIAASAEGGDVVCPVAAWNYEHFVNIEIGRPVGEKVGQESGQTTPNNILPSNDLIKESIISQPLPTTSSPTTCLSD